MPHLEKTNSSLARRLVQSGFKQTSIMRAITELVSSYLWETKVEWKLLNQLQITNSAANELVVQPLWEIKPEWLTSWELQSISNTVNSSNDREKITA